MNLPARVPTWIRMFFPNRIWQMNVQEKVLFISFDDGPHEMITPQVLDMLAKHGAKATFFCHHHLNGWKTHDEKYQDDIIAAAGCIPSNLFRPPYGRLTSSQARRLQAAGFQVVMWSVLSADYNKEITKEKCAMRVLKNIQPGAIVLFHDSEKAAHNMLYALELLLKYATELGYRLEAIPYKKGSA
jgi:peptidoglycan/xylan/chitin deacetylase (PgdA/CDA1 family)